MEQFREVLLAMHLLLVVLDAHFHQQSAHFVLHLYGLPHQQVAITQHSSSISNLAWRHMALRKVVTAQQVGDLASIYLIVLLLACRDRFQHRRVRHLHRRSTLSQVVVNPPGEHRRFHPRRPGLWQGPHPYLQCRPGGCNGIFPQERSIGLSDAIADGLLVYVQSHVMHIVYGFSSGLITEAAFLAGVYMPEKRAPRLYIKTQRNRGSLIVDTKTAPRRRV